MQARIAYRCALVLRDLIHPYLLRRQKKDLEGTIHLPEKTEQASSVPPFYDLPQFLVSILSSAVETFTRDEWFVGILK